MKRGVIRCPHLKHFSTRISLVMLFLFLAGPATILQGAEKELDPHLINVDLQWHWAVLGTQIGRAGLFIEDIDGDGTREIVASASRSRGGGSSYWNLLKPDGEGYIVDWASIPLDIGYTQLVVGQFDADPALEVVIASDDLLVAYDGLTRKPEYSLNLEFQYLQGMAAGQLDGDPALELFLCDPEKALVVDLASVSRPLYVPGLGCSDVEIGNVDDDAQAEIVIAKSGEPGLVLAGQSLELKWEMSAGFGMMVELADLFGDGRKEIVAAPVDGDIVAMDGRSGKAKWRAPSGGLEVLRVGDVEGDGLPEVLYGKWAIHVLDGAYGFEKWRITDPQLDISNLVVGDVQNNGTPEILTGTRLFPPGEEYLLKINGLTQEIDWLSYSTWGPFLGFAHGDIDADSKPELLFSASGRQPGDLPSSMFFTHDAISKSLEDVTTDSGRYQRDGIDTIQVANVDDDPALEIFVPGEDSHWAVLQCIDGASKEVQWVQEEYSKTFRTLQIGDVDGDGDQDVVASFRSHGSPNIVRIYNASTGALEWSSPSLEGHIGSRNEVPFLKLANVDADDTIEIIAGNFWGLVAIDPVTSEIEFSIPEYGLTSLDTEDLNNDQVEEIIIGNFDGEIVVIDTVSLSESVVLGPIGEEVSAVVATLINGDEVVDYVYAAANRVSILNGANGQTMWQSEVLDWSRFSLPLGYENSMIIDDIDDDGLLEIWVSAGYVGQYIFEISPNGIVHREVRGTGRN